MTIFSTQKLYNALVDLSSSQDAEKWKWSTILTDENIKAIVNKLPYTERMLDFILPINRDIKSHYLLAEAIVSIIDKLAPKAVLQIENDLNKYIVFKSGSAFTVNLTAMDCSCGHNLYRKGSSFLNGMCPHIARVIAVRESESDKLLFKDKLALIKYHARKNTESSMDDYKLLHSFSIEGKRVSLYDASIFIYVTYMGDASSYNKEYYTWCWNCHIKSQKLRQLIEIEILAFLGFPMPLPKALYFQTSDKDVGKLSTDHQTSLTAFPIIENGNIFKDLKININFHRIKNKTVIIEILWAGIHLKKQRTKECFTLENQMFNRLPELFSAHYLKLIECFVLTCLKDLKTKDRVLLSKTNIFSIKTGEIFLNQI